jgi:carboxypeptidase Q
MKLNKFYFTLFALLVAIPGLSQPLVKQNIKETSDKLIKSALANDLGFERLAHLTDYYGPRLSGSEVLEQGIDWVVQENGKKTASTEFWTQPVYCTALGSRKGICYP